MRKQIKETDQSIFFMTESAGLPARAKRKHGQLFLIQVKLTSGLDFPIPHHFVPYTPEFYCLALAWGRKKNNTDTHFAWVYSSSPVAAKSR